MKKNRKKHNPLFDWAKNFFVGYKKQFWYITGLVLTFLSIIVMVVSMIFMYFGSFISVAWFIGACPVIVFGILTSASVKRRYEEAVAYEHEPIPMFWHIRYAILIIREFIIKHGLWRFAFIILTAASLIVTIVFAGICGHYYLERDDIKRNVDYMSNNHSYEQYLALWEESYLNGNYESADEYYKMMEKYQYKNAQSNAQIAKYTKSLHENLIKLGISAAVTVFLGTVFVAYILRMRRLSKQQKS